MKSNKNEEVSNIEMEQMLRSFRAGLDRFYSEGFSSWSKDIILKSFHNKININDIRLLTELKKWESEGWIRIVGNDDIFVEVTKNN